MAVPTHLTEAERRQVNAIFARIWKKYHVAATSQADAIEINTPLTMEEARIVAQAEFEVINMTRVDQIHNRADHQISRQNDRRRVAQERHNVRIARINTDAQQRGLALSTIVLSQLERANAEKHSQDQVFDREIENIELVRSNGLARLHADNDQRIEALAKRIHADSLRTNIAAVRERSASQSRAYRDLLQLQQVRLVAPINVQQMADDETHGTLMHWLFTNKTPQQARALVNNDPVFTWNFILSMNATRFRNEVQRRSPI